MSYDKLREFIQQKFKSLPQGLQILIVAYEPALSHTFMIDQLVGRWQTFELLLDELTELIQIEIPIISR